MPASRWSRRCCAMPTSRAPTRFSPPAMPRRCCRSRGSGNGRCSRGRCIARRASSIGPMRMARRLGACILTLFFLVQGVAAEDEVARGVYASMEPRIRAEYEAMLAGFSREAQGSQSESALRVIKLLKVIYYNKAALHAACVAESDRVLPPDAANDA